MPTLTDDQWANVAERLGNALAHDPVSLRAAVEAIPKAPSANFRVALRQIERARLQAHVDAGAANVAALAAETD